MFPSQNSEPSWYIVYKIPYPAWFCCDYIRRDILKQGDGSVHKFNNDVLILMCLMVYYELLLPVVSGNEFSVLITLNTIR